MSAELYPDDATLAFRLADSARKAIQPYFRSGMTVENKALDGFDPVTQADRAAEQAMRTVIEQECPEDGVLGEEFQTKLSRNGRSWTFDPIDGTRGFIAGSPTWCVLIALTLDEIPRLGVIDQPFTGERYFGDGQSASLTHKGQTHPIKSSGVTQLSEAILATTDPHLFEGDALRAFDRVRQGARLTRYGMDAYAYALVALGTIDLVIETGLGPHDMHALLPVVKGAGGIITNWQGGDDLSRGQLIAAATPELHAQALALLA